MNRKTPADIYAGESSLTHNLHKQHSLVFSGGVVNNDGVVPLVLPLRPLYDEAAQVFPGLHPHATFGLCDWLNISNYQTTNTRVLVMYGGSSLVASLPDLLWTKPPWVLVLL